MKWLHSALLGEAVLGVHLVVIAFNVMGLIAIPLGAALDWRWVRIRWWRALHIASWAVVALQAAIGRACFLTIWQDQLTGEAAQPPLVARWINRAIYWPLPIWAFAVIYLVLFGAVIALWWAVPPRRTRP